MPDIFISYAHEDHKGVQLLADALTKKGWSVWWDKGIRSGQNFRMSIQSSLNQAGCVLVAWSRHSAKSPWTIDEAERGYKRNILVPVIIEEDVDLPLGFGGMQTADITEWLNDPKQDATFEQLCKDIAAVLNESAPGSQRVPLAIVSRQLGTSAVFRERRWLWMVAIFLVSALVIFFFMFGPQSKTDFPIVEKVDYAINNLRCQIPSAGKSTVTSEIARPIYSLDLKQHLLIGNNGKPVSSVTATDGDKLQSRKLIVVHTTTQVLEVDRSNFTHVLITRDGTVKQLVPFDRSANHVSNTNWKGLSPVKNHTIGIDLENAGQLQYQDNAWQAWTGEKVPINEIVGLKGDINSRAWHKFTDVQIRAFFEVVCVLRRAYPTIEDMIEHSEIDSVGDPGLVFPLEELRTKLFRGWMRTEDESVSTTKQNFRKCVTADRWLASDTLYEDQLHDFANQFMSRPMVITGTHRTAGQNNSWLAGL